MAHVIEVEPASFKTAADLMRDILQGPVGYISRLFMTKFKGKADSWSSEELSVLRHDFNNNVQWFEYLASEEILNSAFNGADIKKLQSMHMLARLSTRLIEHTHYVLLPHIFHSITNGIDIEVDIDHDLHYREGLNLTLIGKTLANLVDNSIKYHDDRKGKNRFIKISWDGQIGAIIVEDNGTGIKDTEKAWLEHEREADRHPGIAGTGLGLAIVRKIIEELGWRIELESEVGRGTRFIIYPKQGDIIKGAAPPSSYPITGAPPGGEITAADDEITDADYEITAADDEEIAYETDRDWQDEEWIDDPSTADISSGVYAGTFEGAGTMVLSPL